MQQPTPQDLAPGWYPDAAGVQRWWDGARWTVSAEPWGRRHPVLASVIALVAAVIAGRIVVVPLADAGPVALVVWAVTFFATFVGVRVSLRRP
jgi:hypothetical protein